MSKRIIALAVDTACLSPIEWYVKEEYPLDLPICEALHEQWPRKSAEWPRFPAHKNPINHPPPSFLNQPCLDPRSEV
jgi:hypothetical protein